MASEYVRLSDIIIPDVWTPYIMELTKVKSALFNSGIIATNSELDAVAKGAGTTFNVPMFKDLDSSEASDILTDNTALETNKITTAQMVGVKNYRGRAYASNDLTGELAGADPLAAIASRVAEWWARDLQKTTISVLEGVFAALQTAGYPHVVDKTSGTPSDANRISATNIIDGFAALGDAGDDLQAILMHSRQYWSLVKQDLITFEPYSEQDGKIPQFFGRPVIVDDSMPVTGSGATAKYAVYLFTRGVLGYGEGLPKEPVETDRDILMGNEVLVTRKSYLIHPNGMSWVGTPASTSPSNTEFANGANWSPVFAQKNISMVKLLVNP